jgi:hypothetical protein
VSTETVTPGQRFGAALGWLASASAIADQRRVDAELARADMVGAVLAALDAGVPVVTVARVAGVSRQTVYAMMRRDNAAGHHKIGEAL